MKTTPLPPEVVKAQGSRFYLADGREITDGIASWWTACHGYADPLIEAAVKAQLRKLPHIMLGGLVHEPVKELAKRLKEITPAGLNHVFFADSGSVAVEVALKTAVQYRVNRGEKGRHLFLSFKDGYHGDTLGAMSVCDPYSGMHAYLGEYVPQNLIAPLPRHKAGFEQVKALVSEHKQALTGVIIEPLVQGAGGMKFHEAEVLRFLRTLCDENDLLLIFDEIMTGFGRTGCLFAADEAGVCPDIMTLGKALTGGTLTLAATLVTTKIFEAFWDDDPKKALMHGPTFMGNPLACAAAHASLDLFEQHDRLGQVRNIERQLREKLAPCQEIKGVKEVRVKGAVGVVEMQGPVNTALYRDFFLERGVWLRPFGNIFYTTPPFIVTEEELSRICAALTEAVLHFSAEAAA